MKVSVYNTEGKETSKSVSLSKDIFGIEPNNHAIYLDVKHYLAAQRQGTHKAKERADIKGSTRKIKKQKGTGTARAGSIKNPLFRGGGRIFGPRVRDYNITLNTKTKQTAKNSALSYKIKDEAILVVDSLKMKAIKTKEYIKITEALSVNSGKSLFVVAEGDNNLFLSSRNIKDSNVVRAAELNTYEIMNAKHIVFEEGAIKNLEENLK